MTAAQHALAEGDAQLAAQRLVYARDAEPENPAVLRLLTAAFWQAGNLPAAGRTVRDWARVETDRPTPERYASRIYEDMGAVDLAADAAFRAAERAPADASAWERLGRLRLRLGDRPAAISALERARLIGPTLEGMLDLALAHHLAGDVGAEVSIAAAATQIAPESRRAWSTYAHALARTDRCRSARALPASAGARHRCRGCGPARTDSGVGAARALGAERRLSTRRRPPSAPIRTTRPSPRARTRGRTRPTRALGPRTPGNRSSSSSTPSSSPIRHTSRRSSSISTHAPAEAGNTTWSPGLTGILRRRDPTSPARDRPRARSRAGAAARRSPAGTSRPGATDAVGVELLDHDRGRTCGRS